MPLNIRFFRIFSILTMAHFFLPIVFENLFFPLDRKYFYFLGWVTALLFFHPKIFIFKRFIPIYFFAIWYSFFIFFGLYNVDLGWIRQELEALFFAVVMLQYFLSKDINWLKPLMIISTGFIVVTIFTSIIGLQSYPNASRDLAGGLLVREEFALMIFYQSIGIAGYDFFYGLAFVMPTLLAFVKLKTIATIMRIGFILLVFLVLFGIVKSQFTAAFLFALIGSGVAFWTDEKIRPTLFRLITILLVVVFFPKDLVGDLIYSFSRMLDEGKLQSRLNDFSVVLSYGLGGEQATHFDRRYARIPLLLENFFLSPLVGGGISLRHNWLIDRLSMFGLSGVLPWAILIWFQTKYNLKVFSEKTKIYYLITIILWISMGLIKNMGQQRIMIFLFFVIPSLLIVKDKLINNR